ncbi:MAG: PAS domain S-box protein [Candidatus Odinarchaeota archaeon]
MNKGVRHLQDKKEEKRIKKQSAMISVLLVDDEPDLLELAVIFLKEENDCFQIDSSTSAIDVLAEKTYENYDVIVSDYQMPDMDGLEFLAAIRNVGIRIPFVIFTGRGREEVAIKALNLGANHYIQKGGDLKSQFSVLARTITSEVERDRSATLLEESERKYRSLVETSPDGIVLTDLSGVILMVNQQAARMAGVTVPEELVGRSAFEFFLPEDRSLAMENLNETLALGITRNTRYELQRKDGTAYWAELSASVILGADDKPERFMAVIRDISDRKLVEEALKASERNARALLEAIPDLMFRFDKEGRYLSVHGPEELLFTSRESLLGKKLLEVLPEEVGRLGQDKIEQALQSRKKQVFQYELLISDKSHGFDCRMVPLGEEEVLAIVRDITELTDTTRSLKTLEWELTIRNRIANIFLTVQGEEAYGEALNVILDALNSKHGIFGYISIAGDLVSPSLTTDIWEQCQVPGKSYIFPPESWGGIWGQTLREGKPRLSNEPFKVPEGHVAVSRALSVPVVFQGQVIGLLMVANKHVDYDLPDRKLLETIASSFAPVLHARQQRTLKEEERKKAERALRESERRFRTIFNEANDGLLLADTQTRKFISGNKKICKMLGYELEELVQLGVMDIHPGESLLRVIGQFEKQAKEEIGISRLPVKRKDGTVFQADISARPITVDGKRCLLGIFRDVTDQERVKQALQKSEERLTRFMDASTDNFFLYNKDLDLVEINKTALNFFPGMKKKELLGLNIVDIAPDVKESGRYDLYREVMKTGRPVSLEHEVILPESAKLHFAVKAFKVGEGLGISTTDITRRVQVEEELRKSEARYRAVVSDQTEFIVRNLPDGTRTFVNDAYCRYFQQSREDLIGSSFFPLVVEEDREIILEKWKTLTLGNPVAVDEHRSIRPDGKIAWHQWSDRAIFDQDGNVVEYQSVGRDITDQKLAELALKSSEERYRVFFEDSPVSLWDEDFSSVKTYLDALRGSGVRDFNDYFEKNPEEVIKCASKVIVNDINKATLELYGAKAKEEILENLLVIFAEDSYDAFKQEIINIAKGNFRFKLEAVNRTLTGKKITAELRWSVIPGHEDDLSRVLVAITDISERKAYQEHLEELVKTLTAHTQEQKSYHH